MRTLTMLKLGLAVAGIAIWGYGTRVDDARIQWLGIALVAVAALLRFFGRRGTSGEGEN